MGEIFRIEKAAQPLGFTGERLTSAACGQIEVDHCHRYFIARDYCRGKGVLDIASGEGYGAALLAQVARFVVGVELNAASVAHAKKSYSHQNLHFLQGDARRFPLPAASIDVVVSFETLEHFAEQETFLREVKRVLKPDGVLLISTPDRDVYSPADTPANPYHIRELTRGEFQALLGEAFSEVSIYAQRVFFGSAVVPTVRRTSTGGVRTFEKRDAKHVEADNALPRAPILIALASDRPLENLFPGSLYISKSEIERDKNPLCEELQTSVPIQLYPFGATGYCEDGSIRQRIPCEEWRSVTFELPHGAGSGPIRIDPAESRAVIQIGRIAVTDCASGTVLWQADTPTALRSLHIAGPCVLLPGDDAYLLLSYGGDPQIQLPRLESSLRPLSIEIHLRVDKAVGLIYEALERYLRALQEKVERSRVELTTSHTERMLVAAELKRIATERNGAHAELKRTTEALQSAETRKTDEERLRKRIESELAESKSRLQSCLEAERLARESLSALQARVVSLEENLAAEHRIRVGLEKSASWKITKPARAIMRILRGALGH